MPAPPRLLGAAVLLLVLAVCAAAEPPTSARAAASRQRRSDDYDNMDNFLMGASDYDNFFLKTAKSVPRIGRRSEGGNDDHASLRVDRRSTDMNERVPSYAHGYDHFFLKASKSVPRIGKRNDEFFMKTAKSVPRIGRRSEDDQALSKVEEGEWPVHGALGGNDAILGRPHGHRIQRRNYDELMAKAAKTVPRMGKRMHPALDEVGDWGTEQQWPWFRQQDSSPGPYKRANPADFIDLRDVPWESVDKLLRKLEARRGVADDDKLDLLLLTGEASDKMGDLSEKWAYNVHATAPPSSSKELAEARFQPDVKRRR